MPCAPGQHYPQRKALARRGVHGSAHCSAYGSTPAARLWGRARCRLCPAQRTHRIRSAPFRRPSLCAPPLPPDYAAVRAISYSPALRPCSPPPLCTVRCFFLYPPCSSHVRPQNRPSCRLCPAAASCCAAMLCPYMLPCLVLLIFLMIG